MHKQLTTWSHAPDPAIDDMSTSYMTKAEIRSAMKKLKNGKASGVDGITAELLKTDTQTTIDSLERLFKVIWDCEEVPNEWKQGIIVKLPKNET